MGPIRSVLVVEDEPAILELVKFHLEQMGYDAITTGEGRRALEMLSTRVPSLLLLDIMLPDIDGIEILKRVRASQATAALPVILLTARAEEADRILGLEIGADDYVVKPFSPRELMLRIGKLIDSRENIGTNAAPIHFGCLEVDQERFRVTVEGRKLDISATEMRLLSELLRCRGKVLSRDQLLQNAWGYLPNVTARTVDTHVKRLRQKLGNAAVYLETIRGIGYRWAETPEMATGCCDEDAP